MRYFYSNKYSSLNSSPLNLNSNLNLNEQTPFAIIYYEGILISLITSNSTICYIKMKGNNLFGSFSSIKGKNLLNYLKNDNNNNEINNENNNFEVLKTFFQNNSRNDLLNIIFKQKYYETM